VEAWFKLDLGSQGTRRTLWETEEYYTMSLEVDEYGYLYYKIGAEYNCESFTTVPVMPDVWNHVALIVDNSTGDLVSKLLYNGELADSLAWPGVVMNSIRYHFYLGTYGNHDNRYFIGSMDEVRIWNVCRTEAEIKENMRKILTGNEAGLACYYRFDHNSGDQLYDYSVNGNHGVWRGRSALQLSPDWLPSDAFVPDVSVVEKKKQHLPNEFTLYQNFPNPFNPQTTIRYSMSKAGEAQIIISNILGVEVKRYSKLHNNAGSYTIGWNGKDESEKDLSSGLYFYRLETSEFTATRKLLLIR